MVRKLSIRLRPGRDDDLIAALEAIPAGDREARMREALRWHLAPGGFRELIDRLTSLLETGTGRAELTDSPEPLMSEDRMAATAQALTSVLAQWGWGED